MNYGYIGPTPINAYGCVLCQREHRRGLDPEYEAHIMRQSKHGTYTRAPLNFRERVIATLLAEGMPSLYEPEPEPKVPEDPNVIPF